MREGSIQVHSENILPIIKKWLYSDKDIFLRELVANGCDAVKKLEKLIFIGEAKRDEEKARIIIAVDKENRTIRIEDNGIGMTEEEVEKYITQVAFSGAQEFIERYKDKAGEDAGIIGHFGLGFYSAFMVSDSVGIDTLSFAPGAKPVHWISKDESAYEIGEGERKTRGTTVTLHISPDGNEFLEDARVREVLRKYCAFMPVEIYFNPTFKEGDKPVNNTSPLWLKAPKDCTNEEYETFYSELFLDFNPPLFWIHLNVDYPFNLRGILYFPKQSSKLEVMPGEIKLYSNQVYIADNIKEVVPEFLMLLKGVLDCPDLPLNVSRSFLQNDRDVQKISRHISKKVSDKLHSIFTEERENYNKYWDDISPFIKFGCIKDESFYDKVKDILLLKTINAEYLTLSEYPKEADGKIFYVSDENVQAQYVRMFREQGLSAAILTHVIDSHFINFIEYKEKDFKFARIDSDIGDAMKSGEAAQNSEQIIEIFKKSIENADVTVKAERLKAQKLPAVMLLSEYSRRMQDMSKMYGEAFAGAKTETTIVLNLDNDIVKSIPSLTAENAGLVCQHIYDLALLGHKPLDADEMAAFIDRSMKILAIIADKKDDTAIAE
jgi:molecular chaperone HtpG